MSREHKPLTAAEIEELRKEAARVYPDDGTVQTVVLRRKTFVGLMSMLTQPTDAAVREAVRYAFRDGVNGFGMYESETGPYIPAKAYDKLLSYIRAVQATRLTREKREAAKALLSEMDKMLGDDIQPDDDRPAALAMQRFCAAFPEVFAGEVDRG